MLSAAIAWAKSRRESPLAHYRAILQRWRSSRSPPGCGTPMSRPRMVAGRSRHRLAWIHADQAKGKRDRVPLSDAAIAVLQRQLGAYAR